MQMIGETAIAQEVAGRKHRRQGVSIDAILKARYDDQPLSAQP